MGNYHEQKEKHEWELFSFSLCRKVIHKYEEYEEDGDEERQNIKSFLPMPVLNLHIGDESWKTKMCFISLSSSSCAPLSWPMCTFKLSLK
jgi:hypothetical protein